MSPTSSNSTKSAKRGRDVTSELIYLTKALKAPALRDAAGRLAERARSEEWSHEEYLAACLQREVAARDSHGAEGRIRAARFPSRKSIEDFDFDHQRSIKRETIAHLGTLDFVVDKENVIFLGPPGTGKTHLATGLGIRACQAGHRVAFATAAQWVTRLAEAHLAGKLSDELTRLSRIPLIVVDEVGYIPFEPEAANLFFQFISGRYEHASVIVTSNKPFGKAHMFRRTRARRCLNSKGSSGGRDRCGHRIGDQRDQLLRPAVRLLGGDVGSAGIADEVGAVQAIEAAASVEAPTVRVSGHSRDVVGIEDEHASVRADRIRPMRHQRWQEPVSRGFLCHRRRHRYFPEVGADSLLTGDAGEDGHGRNSA